MVSGGAGERGVPSVTFGETRFSAIPVAEVRSPSLGFFTQILGARKGRIDAAGGGWVMKWIMYDIAGWADGRRKPGDTHACSTGRRKGVY